MPPEMISVKASSTVMLDLDQLFSRDHDENSGCGRQGAGDSRPRHRESPRLF